LVAVSAGGPRIERHQNDHLDGNFVTNVLLPLLFGGDYLAGLAYAGDRYFKLF